MLKSKVFVKKTRKGGIMKVVREHYLRDDVWCGANHCMNCGQTDQENLLDSTPLSSSKLCSFPHYLLLDTNVVLHQVRNLLLFCFLLRTKLCAWNSEHFSITCKLIFHCIGVLSSPMYTFKGSVSLTCCGLGQGYF